MRLLSGRRWPLQPVSAERIGQELATFRRSTTLLESPTIDALTPDAEMPNDLNQAAYWVAFILGHCPFPNRDALAAQFSNAEIVRLCECGCNSFSLTLAAPDKVPPIAVASSGQPYRMVFEADFRDRAEPEGWGSIEILFFADESGHLADIEIDYCGNGMPIPKNLNLEPTPYNVFVSESLI
ncbi:MULTISPECIES: hypothetical protein [Burkholderia]|uniref:hypothetical protein n=1 Tax=Burkholderia TaxID=32008 RepID=UPI001582D88E|nr:MULTISPECIES: hypothetical protein [Burkholderia]MBN3771598.1 hypothetical protein [Burkholderia sp. Se-20378]